MCVECTSRVQYNCTVLQSSVFLQGHNIMGRAFGSSHVSGDVPTLPWVRSGVWVSVGAGLGLNLREGYRSIS